MISFGEIPVPQAVSAGEMPIPSSIRVVFTTPIPADAPELCYAQACRRRVIERHASRAIRGGFSHGSNHVAAAARRRRRSTAIREASRGSRIRSPNSLRCCSMERGMFAEPSKTTLRLTDGITRFFAAPKMFEYRSKTRPVRQNQVQARAIRPDQPRSSHCQRGRASRPPRRNGVRSPPCAREQIRRRVRAT